MYGCAGSMCLNSATCVVICDEGCAVLFFDCRRFVVAAVVPQASGGLRPCLSPESQSARQPIHAMIIEQTNGMVISPSGGVHTELATYSAGFQSAQRKNAARVSPAAAARFEKRTSSDPPSLLTTPASTHHRVQHNSSTKQQGKMGVLTKSSPLKKMRCLSQPAPLQERQRQRLCSV